MSLEKELSPAEKSGKDHRFVFARLASFLGSAEATATMFAPANINIMWFDISEL